MDRAHPPLLARFFQALLLNFLKIPGKVRIIEHMCLLVAFDPPGHPENALTINFLRGQAILECGIRSDAHIKITGEPAILMMLSRMPAGMAAVGYLKTYEGRNLIDRMVSGQLKIEGIFRHPIGMMKFSRFMAPNID